MRMIINREFMQGRYDHMNSSVLQAGFLLSSCLEKKASILSLKIVRMNQRGILTPAEIAN
jgi:hypothetical protein